MVVLPVGQVPELDRAADVEARPAQSVRLDVQVAHDPRPVGRDRPRLVRQDVVGVNADDEVRPQDVVVDGALVDLVG